MHLLAFVSTLFILTGVFLPWIDPSLFIEVKRGIAIRDGRLVLILALAASALSIFGILRRWKVLGWLYLLMGLLCLCISVGDLVYFWNSNYNAGPGIYLTIAGGAQLALSPLLALLGHSRS